MAENRITQAAVEALTVPARNARLVQLAVESVRDSEPAARMAQFVVEAVIRPPTDFLGATHGDRPFVY